MLERLQKILARHAIASRRASEELILAGKIRVNGKIAKLGDKADEEKDKITINNQQLTINNHQILFIIFWISQLAMSAL